KLKPSLLAAYPAAHPLAAGGDCSGSIARAPHQFFPRRRPSAAIESPRSQGRLLMKQTAAFVLILICIPLVPAAARAQQIPFLPESTVSALAQELSGEPAKRSLEFLARLHRQRGSRDFHAAAEFVTAQARAYGLEDAHVEKFPADGKI